MGQQAIRQRARRQARERAEARRREQVKQEARVIDLATRVLTAIAQREAAVAEAEAAAGEALRELTEVEGLTLSQAVDWCDEAVTLREAARLRRLAVDVAGQDRDEDETSVTPSTENVASHEAAGAAGPGGGHGAKPGTG